MSKVHDWLNQGVSKRQLLIVIFLTSLPLIFLSVLNFIMDQGAAGFLYGFFAAGLLACCLFMVESQKGVENEVSEKS